MSNFFLNPSSFCSKSSNKAQNFAQNSRKFSENSIFRLPRQMGLVKKSGEKKPALDIICFNSFLSLFQALIGPSKIQTLESAFLGKFRHKFNLSYQYCNSSFWGGSSQKLKKCRQPKKDCIFNICIFQYIWTLQIAVLFFQWPNHVYAHA